MERILAFIVILLLLPILALIYAVVRVMDGSPVIFKQERLGRHRRTFTLFKFRSMKDGELTRLGSGLRTTGIDELPQLFNVLLGNMSFVGPRPLTLMDVERLEWTDADFDQRWSVLPGITGPAQLLTVCDKDETMRIDLEYVDRRSLLVDLSILTRSALVPLFGKRTT